MRRCAYGLLALLLLAPACESRPEPAPPRTQAPGDPGAAKAEPVRVPAAGEDGSRGVVYVPVYSHIFFSDSIRSLELATTLSIRNTDPEFPIVIVRVDYYDNDGRLVRSYLQQPRPLGPMASRAHVVHQKDTTGGVGANFIVEWRADRPVTEPLVEAVMISTSAAQGISFTSRGQALVRR